jgi:hypothetical protein
MSTEAAKSALIFSCNEIASSYVKYRFDYEYFNYNASDILTGDERQVFLRVM